MLELRWHVARDVTSCLQGQVLRTIQNSKRVAHDFLLAAKVTCLLFQGSVHVKRGMGDGGRLECVSVWEQQEEIFVVR